MDRYCPECNATMTPSLVGYLCPNCGNMQRFHTQTATISPRIEVLPAGESDDVEDTIKPHEDVNSEASSNNKVKSTLKRLMVPELSPPHHEQLIAGGDHDITAQKADKLPSEFDTANTSSSYKAYQPDQIADDFNSAKPTEPVKHSNAWLWATLVLFIVAAVSLGAIYFLYNR